MLSANPNKIEEMQERLLSSIYKKFCHTWLTSKITERNQRIDDEVIRVERANLTNYLQTYVPWTSSSGLKKPKLASFHGSMIPRRDLADLQANRSQIESNFLDEYNDYFLENYWGSADGWNNILLNQFMRMDLEQVKKQLLDRHPWLGLTHSMSEIVYQFLEELLESQLLKLLKDHNINNWDQLPANIIESKMAEWDPIDPDWLQKHIEGYPVSSVRTFYLYKSNTTSLYPNLWKENKEGVDPNYVPKRLDMWRFLCNVKEDMNSKNSKDGIQCVEKLPIYHDELPFITAGQWQVYKSLLINMGTEQDPLWVLLNLQNESGIWTVYLPEDRKFPGLYENFNEVMNANPHFKGKLNVVYVSHQQNSDLNDIKPLTPTAEWHAILLGKVYPWCKNNPKISLDDYRKNVPLSLMQHSVFEKFVENVNASYGEGDSNRDKNIPKYFRDRKPFSHYSLTTMNNGMRGSDYLLDSDKELEFVKAELILELLDNKTIEIAENHSAIKVDSNKTVVVNDALYLIYHTNICQLFLTKGIENNPTTNKLFSYDINIRGVYPDPRDFNSDPKQFSYPMSCAARNRFLMEYSNKDRLEAHDDIEKRKQLWKTTGLQLLDFLKKHGSEINLDFINEYIAFNNGWRTHHCTDEKPNSCTSFMWSFAQIAQMGTTGLDELFNALEIKYAPKDPDGKDAAPNLDCTFDLNGSIASKSSDYINYLADKIKNFGKRESCAPLFNSLSFIIPEEFGVADRTALSNLILVLQERIKAHPEEVMEISLFNLKNTPDTAIFIDILEKLASANLRIQINIPEWNRAAYEDKAQKELKSRYRKIQNTIANNQRAVNNTKLRNITQNIYACAKGTFDPKVYLQEKRAQAMQPWKGEDIIYPLTSQAPGVQQQLEQELGQEFAATYEKQVEEEQEQEQEQEISTYTEREDLLITRDNIEATCPELWKGVVGDRKITGITDKKLSELFSMWVGSDRDAAHVITKIEPEAMQKIMEHATEFRMGIAKDNLPPGFFLAYSRQNKSLILCFDLSLENKMKRALKATDLSQRNPFTMQLNTPKKANEFRGDYRQLGIYNDSHNNDSDLQTLWQYLAIEDNDPIRIGNAKHVLNKEGDIALSETASVMLQRYDIKNEINPPMNYEYCLQSLISWGKNHNFSSPLLELLFVNPVTRFTHENLKAFGQLFNYFDVQGKAKQNGSTDLFVVADLILKHFGPENFAIWKSAFLDVSINWSELLATEDMNAVALSIKLLEENPTYSAIWWKLVEAHGRSVKHMRYSDLWNAFNKVLTYIDKKKLAFNAEATLEYLSKVDDFNAMVFLDRLHYVLNNTSTVNEAVEVQQNILNNLDKIDWHHNGFYYANRYEGYSTWLPALELTKFRSASAISDPSYNAKWDANVPVSFPVTHALRFASQRAKFRDSDLRKLEKILTALNISDKDTPALRLFVSCLVMGVDQIDNVDIKTVGYVFEEMKKVSPQVVAWLNTQIKLDREFVPGLLKLKFECMVAFVQGIGNFGLLPQLMTSNPSINFEFINACGRALQCYNNSEEDFGLFLTYAKESKDTGILNPLLTDYPWLIKEFYANKSNWQDPITEAMKLIKEPSVLTQLQIFEEQLRSINFSNTKLPPHHVLLNHCMKVANAENGVEAFKIRQQIVNELIENGCAITFQDALFRPLENVEIKRVMDYLEKNLDPNFRAQNVKLCTRFFTDCVAVRADMDCWPQLKSLADKMAHIDNKTHYDELGQVIGALIERAKGNTSKNIKAKKYAGPQLSRWLNTLIDDQVYAQRHFPINLLNGVIDKGLGRDSSLLNHDLNQLRDEVDSVAYATIIERVNKSDLSNQYKGILVKVANLGDLDFVRDAQKELLQLSAADVSANWMDATASLIDFVSTRPPIRAALKRLTLSPANIGIQSDSALTNVWESVQVKLIKLITSEELSYNDLPFLYSSENNALIQIILMQSGADVIQMRELNDQLKSLSLSTLKELARYYTQEPYPNASLLIDLLSRFDAEFKSAPKLIHYFETVSQGLDEKGESKRHYSVDKKSHASLLRVLRGFKSKGRGYIEDAKQKELLNLFYYCNNYSFTEKLSDLNSAELKKKLFSEIEGAKSGDSFAAARLLACMREILLRQTGKWANHTQMLDLLYAALHNGESLLHQVRTGQGKSIISVMRAAYLALNGYTVDVFSAKVSLSKRDHDEFAHVFDAMEIPHAYITENSPANMYKTSARGVGGVNYETIGNFSLFHSKLLWTGEAAIDMNREKRVAWIDECDHILKYEQTQFNYSDGSESDAVYNMDEWVYRVAFDYYIENKNDFIKLKDGTPAISRLTHLKQLCERLQKQSVHSPAQSKFLQKYILPTLSEDPEVIKKRDQYLKYLLTAAHTADKLEPNNNYCIRSEIKVVSGGNVINTRAAKVMIDNQISYGSSYSDLVQQFLHVKLNKEAAAAGESPNFFVDPYTQIALSQNASYLLKKYYKKLEGCSGTVGNSEMMQMYEAIYGIQHVVKLPTHEPIGTQFLETSYCDSEKAQVEEIVQQILNNKSNMPILITCKDDIAVKRLGRKINEQLKNHYNLDNVIIDTNDSGKPESEIVPRSGQLGMVTISSRMGRGTDIKPATKEGLMVLRTYPAPTNVAKQEQGRQGRNGAKGICKDILNYKKIAKQYNAYLKTSYGERLLQIRNDQERHLERKLQKHVTNESTKFNWLKDEIKKEKYLNTRVLVQMNEEIKEEREKYLRRKEYLIATLSGEVMDALHEYIKHHETGPNSGHKNLCERWLECRKQIEAAWNERLNNKNGDSEDVYAAFIEKAAVSWEALCDSFPEIDRTIIGKLVASERGQRKKTQPINEEITQEQDTTPILTFYQGLMAGAEKNYRHKDIKAFVMPEVYGKYHEKMDKFYGRLVGYWGQKIPKEEVTRREYIFGRLTVLTNSPSLYCVSADALRENIDRLMLSQHKTLDTLLSATETFFTKTSLAKVKPADLIKAEEIKRCDNLLLLSLDIAALSNSDKKNTLVFIQHFCDIIHEDFWDNFESDDIINEIKKIFCAHGNVLDLLIANANNKADLRQFIHLIRDNSSFEKGRKQVGELLNYLAKNVVNLQANPALIRPLFIMHLGDSKINPQMNYRPDIKSLPKLSAESRSAFWHFLTQRLPIVEKECNNLIEKIAEHGESEGFVQNVLKPLLDLPPHIPLSYINKVIHFAPGKHHFYDCKIKLERIAAAGEALNHFMFKMQSIRSTNEYSPTNMNYYNRCVVKFEQISPERNQAFFVKASQLVDKLTKLSNSNIQTFIVEKINEHLFSNSLLDEKMIEELQAFLSVIKKGSHELDTATIKQLYITWVAYRFNKDTMALFNDLLQFDKTHNPQLAFKLQKDFFNKPIDAKTTLKYREFLELANTPGYNALLTDNLVVAYFVGSMSIISLKENLDVLKGIYQFEMTHPALTFKLQSSFFGTVMDAKATLKYREFLALANNPNYAGLFTDKMLIDYFNEVKSAALLKENLDVLKSIEEFDITHPRLQNKLKDYFHLTNMDAHSTLQYREFLEIGMNPAYTELFTDELIANYFTGKSAALLIQNLQVLQGIQQLEKNHSALTVNLKDKFLASNMDVRITMRLQEFLAIGNDPEYRDLFTDKIVKDYLNVPFVIKNVVDLKRNLEVIKQAKVLQTTKNYSDYFSNFKCAKATERKTLMQFLQHDLVKIDTTGHFKKHCFEQYSALAKKITKPPEKLYKDKRSARAQLRTSYQEIIGFAREVAEVSVHPFNGMAPKPKISGSKKDRKDYFESQRTQYASFWFTNTTRKAQATTLFDKLAAIANNMTLSNSAYYQNTLTAIWTAQQEILDNDTDKYNKKGFSRLYDISIQMFLTVARDLLKDKDVTDKTFLNTLLQQQLVYNVQKFQDRLPDKSPLKAALVKLSNKAAKHEGPWHPGSLELMDLSKLLQQHNKSIPSYLRYIATNIESLVCVSNDNTAQSSPVMREGKG